MEQPRFEWIPSPEDNTFIESLMGRVIEPGKFAGLDRAASARHQGQTDRLRICPIQLSKSSCG